MAAPLLRGFRPGLVTTRLSRAVRSRRFNFQQLSGHPLRASLLLIPLLLQTPDDGWGVVRSRPREVTRIYWELLKTTEVFVRLTLLDSDGKPVRVNLVFQAFFPGRAERDPYSGLPRWPKGSPARLAITAQAFSMTFVIPELSLRLAIDGAPVELTGPDNQYRNIPCPIAVDDCSSNGVEADLQPAILRSLIAARAVQGRALGFSFKLTPADQAALADFADRIGLPPTAPGGARVLLPNRRSCPFVNQSILGGSFCHAGTHAGAPSAGTARRRPGRFPTPGVMFRLGSR